MDDDGHRFDEPLVSGENSEWFVKADAYLREHLRVPAVRNPRLAAVPSASHVEVHAAMIMRERGLTHATLVINNDRICRGVRLYPQSSKGGSEHDSQRGARWSVEARQHA